MKLFAKFFWPLLPVVLLLGTYREATSSVRRYWQFATDDGEAWETYKDLGKVATKVAIYYKTTQRLPVNLPEFLKASSLEQDNRGRPLHEDAWRTPYQLRDNGSTYDLVSCGPDKDCATVDDNLVETVRKVKPASAAEAGSGPAPAAGTNAPGRGASPDAVFKQLENTKKLIEQRQQEIP
jgi:hypothetical protein